MIATRLLLSLTCAGIVVAGAGTIVSTNLRATGWMRVAADSNYVISLDTSRMTERYGAWPVVWYRTDHALPRLHKREEFNREVVRSIVRCDSLWFKVASVDMSMGSSKPVARQRAEKAELHKQPWRSVERGTIEEVVARAACARAATR